MIVALPGLSLTFFAFIMSAAASGFSTIMYKLVSSANNLILQFNSKTIPLM